MGAASLFDFTDLFDRIVFDAVRGWGKRMKPLRLTMLLCLVLAACTKPALPVLGEISEFHLTTQEGRSFSKSDMAGKIWVANFIFTSCAGTCPLLTERMKKLQTSLNAGMENPERAPLHFVSFSVDPERDTPEVLQEYAKRHDVDLSNWTFLTGPFEEVSRTVVKGFKVSMGKVPVSAETA
ncbi:MAG TPA: hypothetical protein DF383_05330, partial [Deltaproteobacteria bacterium]|nr:hypothetical protein [Deltaproteobacteria bacterium]